MGIGNTTVLNTFTEWLLAHNQIVNETNKMTEGIYITTGNVKVTGTSVTGDVLSNVAGISKATTFLAGNGSVTMPAFGAFSRSNTGIYFPTTNTMSLVTASNDVVYLTPAGNVSVGGTQANAKLDVSGTFRASGLTSFSSNVGIGKTAPAYALDVVGDIWATGNITMESDARVKENIKPLVGSLSAVKGMSGVSYNKIATKHEQIGLIAQEVQNHYPQIVTQREDGVLGVNYSGMVGVLLEAVKELSSQVDELKTELRRIKRKNSNKWPSLL